MEIGYDSKIITIPIGEIKLEGELIIPKNSKGLIIFSHGSGSSRHSVRNKAVAKKLNESGLATLLVDLLSEQEDTNYETRFDINLLTVRLLAITDWVKEYGSTKGLPIGYFGASTGAASAILAADGSKSVVKAIVSRGGRVDLVYDMVGRVQVPTLLIVGEKDQGVRDANEAVYKNMTCKKRLEIVPNATHLFEEPGAIEQVAELATNWFVDNLKS